MEQHAELKNLYEDVKSGKFLWDRFSLLGVLADYVLYYTKGDILEIGCGESSIWLSTLAKKYNRTCHHVEYSKSGVENMKRTQGYFTENSEVHNMKSDDFFKQTIIIDEFCLSFIDGDHTYEQVRKDFLNVLKYTVKDGYIFLHDTLPPNDEWKIPSRCGTVFKLREELEEKWGHVELFTFPFSAFNVGLTMLRKLF